MQPKSNSGKRSDVPRNALKDRPDVLHVCPGGCLSSHPRTAKFCNGWLHRLGGAVVDWKLVAGAVETGASALLGAIILSWMIGPFDEVTFTFLAVGAAAGYLIGRKEAPSRGSHS